jgi:CheY-like chemotaxis protein
MAAMDATEMAHASRQPWPVGPLTAIFGGLTMVGGVILDAVWPVVAALVASSPAPPVKPVGTGGQMVGVGGLIATIYGIVLTIRWMRADDSKKRIAANAEWIVEQGKRIDELQQANEKMFGRIQVLESMRFSLTTVATDAQLEARRWLDEYMSIQDQIIPGTLPLPAPITVTVSSAGATSGPLVPPEGVLLIVEDHEDMRAALKRSFEMGDDRRHDIEGVGTVAQALAALESPQGPPSLILLDMGLPDGDGTEVLRAVRERRLPARVYLMTGRHEQELESARALAPDGVFLKPVDFRRMRDLMLGPRPAHPPMPTITVAIAKPDPDVPGPPPPEGR